MPSVPFFFFWCHISAFKLCLHTFTPMTVTLRGVGDYSKKSIAAEKCIVVSVKFMARFERKY